MFRSYSLLTETCIALSKPVSTSEIGFEFQQIIQFPKNSSIFAHMLATKPYFYNTQNSFPSIASQLTHHEYTVPYNRHDQHHDYQAHHSSNASQKYTQFYRTVRR